MRHAIAVAPILTEMAGAVDLQHLIRRAGTSYPERLGVSDGHRSLTLAELVAQAERLANALEGLGVPADARIAILSENRAEYVIADLGIALARRVRVALNARLQLADHRYVISNAGVSVLIHSAGFAAEAEALRTEAGLVTISFDSPSGASLDFHELLQRASATPVQRPGDVEDTAWITYTAGTTGRPKGVVLSRRAIREVTYNLLLELGPVRPGHGIVLPQALSHGAGYFVLPWLLSGGSLHVLQRFDPEEILTLGERPDVRVLKCVPAMLPDLLKAADKRPFGFESIVYGAAPISRPVLAASLERFGPILTQIYGQSEAPATLTCLHAEDHLGDGEQRFSAGRPWRTVTIEIRDEAGNTLAPGEQGEVCVTGSHLMTGYHGLPELTADVLCEGWLRTRDCGVLDERGFLYLRGRMDEMINSGGYNISPREVEEVLCDFPGVEEATVVGVPDERWGTAVAAAVKLAASARASSEEVVAFTRKRLGFRSPKLVRIVGAIPKTSYGKVDRKKVLSMMLEAQNEVTS